MRELRFTMGDNVIQFKLDDFEDNMDLDKLLKIDYSNLLAELITFPVVVNRFGLLAAEMDGILQEEKLNLSIYEAKAKERIRNEFGSDPDKKRYTVGEVDDALLMDKIWQKKKQKFNRVTKEKEFMYSIYQSAKDKSHKLDKLSMSLKFGDMDEQILQSQLNKVYFNIKKGTITND